MSTLLREHDRTEDTIFIGCVVGESVATPANALSTSRVAELVCAQQGKWPADIIANGKQTGVLSKQAFVLLRALQGRNDVSARSATSTHTTTNTEQDPLFDGALFLDILTKFAQQSSGEDSTLDAYMETVLSTWSTMKSMAPGEWWLPAHKVWKMKNHDKAALETFYNAPLVRNSAVASTTMQCADQVAMVQTVRHTVATHSHPLYVLCNGLHTFIIRNEHDTYRRFLPSKQHKVSTQKKRSPYTIGSVKKWIEGVWRPWRASTEDEVCLAWLGLWSPSEMHQAEHLFLHQFVTILSNGDHGVSSVWNDLHTIGHGQVQHAPLFVQKNANYFNGGTWEKYTFQDELKPFLWIGQTSNENNELCTLTLALSIWCLDWSHSSTGYALEYYPSWMRHMDASLPAYETTVSILRLSGFDTIQWPALLGGECRSVCMVAGALLSAKYGSTNKLMHYARDIKDIRYLRNEFYRAMSIQTKLFKTEGNNTNATHAPTITSSAALTRSTNDKKEVASRLSTPVAMIPMCSGNAIPLPLQVFESMGAGDWQLGTLYQDSQKQYWVRCPLSWQMQRDAVYASVKAAAACTAATLQAAVKDFQEVSSWTSVFDMFSLEHVPQPHISIAVETKAVGSDRQVVERQLKALLHQEIKVSLVDSNIVNWQNELRGYDHIVSNNHLYIPLVNFGVSVQFENSLIGRLTASHVALCSFNALKTSSSKATRT
jgi:hypothetical protein